MMNQMTAIINWIKVINSFKIKFDYCKSVIGKWALFMINVHGSQFIANILIVDTLPWINGINSKLPRNKVTANISQARVTSIMSCWFLVFILFFPLFYL